MPVSENIIKISGDNRKLKATLKETDNLFKSSSRVTKQYASILQKELKTANAELLNISKNLTKIDNQQAFKKQIAHVKQLKSELQGISGGGGGGRGMMGISGGAGGGRGGGMMGMLGKFLGPAAIFGGAIMAARARIATARTGLQLTGLGSGGMARSNVGMGFGVQETLQQRLGLAKTLGTGGGLENLQMMARATGVGVEDLTSSTGVMRRAGLSGRGESVTAIRKTMKILSQTLGDTLDKGRIGEYLKAIDQSTSTLSGGVNVDTDALTQAFGNLTKQSFYQTDPQRTVRALNAVDSTFKTATDARFGWVMKVTASALKSAGVKASMADVIYEGRRGTFAKGGEGSLFGKDRSKFMLGAMQEEASRMLGDNPTMSLRGQVGRKLFPGIGIEEQAKLMKALASGTLTKEMAEGGKSLEELASDAMGSIDGNIESSMAFLSAIKDSIGDNLAISISAIARAMDISPKDLKSPAQIEKEEDLKTIQKLTQSMNMIGPGGYEFGAKQRAAIARGKTTLPKDVLNDLKQAFPGELSEHKARRERGGMGVGAYESGLVEFFRQFSGKKTANNVILQIGNDVKIPAKVFDSSDPVDTSTIGQGGN